MDVGQVYSSSRYYLIGIEPLDPTWLTNPSRMIARILNLIIKSIEIEILTIVVQCV